MNLPWLYEMPLWLDGVLFLSLLLAAMEVGFRLGLRRHRAGVDAERETAGDVTLGALLALLGLMLAFTYAFSMSRADLRKEAVVSEANAIGTAFLRADLAPEPGRSELRSALLDYARTRVSSARTVRDRAKLEAAIARSVEVQRRLWPATRLALEGDLPAPLQASLVQAVNEVIDAHTRRIAVVYDRIPGAVMILLLLIGAAAMGTAAHHAGLTGRTSNRWRLSAFAVVLAALMFLILDFDVILRGFVRVNHDSLLSQIREMEAALAE